MKRISLLAVALILLPASSRLSADEPSNVPKPIPATRPELKSAIEALKERQPRLPLSTSSDGESISNYLPESWGGGGGLSGFGQLKLNHLFTDRCFWVVSRGNNCHYCLGHQELKLRAAGMDEDAIASLDSDWSRFDPRQQAALAFARKLTLEPGLVGDADIEQLEDVFSAAEIIELAFTIARFNALNRWTDGIGLPQERHLGDEGEITFTTPTSEQYQDAASVVVAPTMAPRLPLPTWEDSKRAIVACRVRNARVELPTEERAMSALASVIGDRRPLNWERAMSQLAAIGAVQIRTLNTIMSDDHLPVRLKTELALICAVHNRAWYAAGHATDRLRRTGLTTEQMKALFKPRSEPTGAAAAYRLAAKSTTDPQLITDADIASVREHYSDAETAQIMQVICVSNMFDRFTEAIGLPLEKDIAEELTPLP